MDDFGRLHTIDERQRFGDLSDTLLVEDPETVESPESPIMAHDRGCLSSLELSDTEDILIPRSLFYEETQIINPDLRTSCQQPCTSSSTPVMVVNVPFSTTPTHAVMKRKRQHIMDSDTRLALNEIESDIITEMVKVTDFDILTTEWAVHYFVRIFSQFVENRKYLHSHCVKNQKLRQCIPDVDNINERENAVLELAKIIKKANGKQFKNILFKRSWGIEMVTKIREFLDNVHKNDKIIDLDYIRNNFHNNLLRKYTLRCKTLLQYQDVVETINHLDDAAEKKDVNQALCCVTNIYNLLKYNIIERTVGNKYDEAILNVINSNIPHFRKLSQSVHQMVLLFETVSKVIAGIENIVSDGSSAHDYRNVIDICEESIKTNKFQKHNELQYLFVKGFKSLSLKCSVCYESQSALKICFFMCGHYVCSSCSKKVNNSRCIYNCNNSKLLSVSDDTDDEFFSDNSDA
uniref:RING-type domain-containing protein n=1 Tax=Nesodiprion zhejiangensis nucleopolyhedrovirus TaxID=3135970 RepID=A0AAN0N6K7_9BACU